MKKPSNTTKSKTQIFIDEARQKQAASKAAFEKIKKEVTPELDKLMETLNDKQIEAKGAFHRAAAKEFALPSSALKRQMLEMQKRLNALSLPESISLTQFKTIVNSLTVNALQSADEITMFKDKANASIDKLIAENPSSMMQNIGTFLKNIVNSIVKFAKSCFGIPSKTDFFSKPDSLSDIKKDINNNFDALEKALEPATPTAVTVVA